MVQRVGRGAAPARPAPAGQPLEGGQLGLVVRVGLRGAGPPTRARAARTPSGERSSTRPSYSWRPTYSRTALIDRSQRARSRWFIVRRAYGGGARTVHCVSRSTGSRSMRDSFGPVQELGGHMAGRFRPRRRGLVALSAAAGLLVVGWLATTPWLVDPGRGSWRWCCSCSSSWSRAGSCRPARRPRWPGSRTRRPGPAGGRPAEAAEPRPHRAAPGGRRGGRDRRRGGDLAAAGDRPPPAPPAAGGGRPGAGRRALRPGPRPAGQRAAGRPPRRHLRAGAGRRPGLGGGRGSRRRRLPGAGGVRGTQGAARWDLGRPAVGVVGVPGPGPGVRDPVRLCPDDLAPAADRPQQARRLPAGPPARRERGRDRAGPPDGAGRRPAAGPERVAAGRGPARLGPAGRGRPARRRRPRTSLQHAELAGAHLEQALLCGAERQGADLRGAHLAGAKVSADTSGPSGFDWRAAGARLVDAADARARRRRGARRPGGPGP